MIVSISVCACVCVCVCRARMEYKSNINWKLREEYNETSTYLTWFSNATSISIYILIHYKRQKCCVRARPFARPRSSSCAVHRASLTYSSIFLLYLISFRDLFAFYISVYLSVLSHYRACLCMRFQCVLYQPSALYQFEYSFFRCTYRIVFAYLLALIFIVELQ